MHFFYVIIREKIGGIRVFYIAVYDDNHAVCSEIEEILFQYKKKTGKSLEVEVFYDGESFLKYQEQGNVFDLVYLDIEMEQGNGLWVSHKLRKDCCNYAIEIVYISGKEGYDRELFAYQPLHFLAKPFTEKQIVEVLELAMFRTEKNRRFFEYKKRQDIYRIPINVNGFSTLCMSQNYRLTTYNINVIILLYPTFYT